MALTNEHVGPMILAKIKIYVFTRAELLFQVCYETPCTTYVVSYRNNNGRSHLDLSVAAFVCDHSPIE